MEKEYDVAIIGAGPAGITAAIYVKRSELSCCIIEKEMPGGQINKTSIVENYPGITKISGPDLAMEFKKQIDNLGITQIYKEVKQIIVEKDYKKIILSNDEIIKAKKIILSIGRSPKKYDNDSFRSLEGKGISYCSLCDGYLYKNENVTVVGGGNSALEESLFLSEICKSVTIIVRSSKLSGEKKLIERVKEKENITIKYNTVIENFNEKDGILESLELLENKEKKNFKTKACFIYIGYEPSSSFLNNLDILDENGYIKVDEEKRTKVNGIYAAGDIVKKEAYQIVTATSDGALAAISCIKDVQNE